MKKNIKETISEILEIVELCPAELKQKCFELLLVDALDTDGRKMKKSEDSGPSEDTKKEEGKPENDTLENPEIKFSNTHVKARKFIESVGIDIINNIFYLEAGEFKPLYDDLKAKTLAESQIRISLLEALKNGLKSGEFHFSVEGVRGLCKDVYKSYDKTNFAANYKNNKELFADEYGSDDLIKISQAGKNRLALILKEL